MSEGDPSETNLTHVLSFVSFLFSFVYLSLTNSSWACSDHSKSPSPYRGKAREQNYLCANGICVTSDISTFPEWIPMEVFPVEEWSQEAQEGELKIISGSFDLHLIGCYTKISTTCIPVNEVRSVNNLEHFFFLTSLHSQNQEPMRHKA